MKKILCALVIVMLIASMSFAAKKAAAQKADLDLTKFSSTMVYSGLFNILSNPSAYTGKTIKLTGQYDVYHDDQTGNDYFGVMIMDASACCAAGIDFVLKDSYKYPEDYPEPGSVITVLGKFEMYKEGEDTFCRLSESEIL